MSLSERAISRISFITWFNFSLKSYKYLHIFLFNHVKRLERYVKPRIVVTVRIITAGIGLQKGLTF